GAGVRGAVRGAGVCPWLGWLPAGFAAAWTISQPRLAQRPDHLSGAASPARTGPGGTGMPDPALGWDLRPWPAGRTGQDDNDQEKYWSGTVPLVPVARAKIGGGLRSLLGRLVGGFDGNGRGITASAPLSPAVSLAFALRGDFPWKRVPGYIIIQLIGATLACLFLDLVFGNVEHLGATLPGPGYKNWQALLMEIVLTALLVSVILGTASAAQNVGAIAALGVGGYIALAGLWAAPVSGVSMNPARSFGPALVSGDFTSYWVYIAGPITGALIAVGCALALRGRGGDAISRAAGSGVLDQGALTAKAKLSEDIDQ